METNEKSTHEEIDFTSILAAASGSGMLVGSVLGVAGAVLGSVVGGGFGYWAQIKADKKNRKEALRGKETQVRKEAVL